MNTTQLSHETDTTNLVPAKGAEKIEVVTIPVADVDRAKAFYLGLGWRLDIDFEPGPGMRGVQFTPPGSPASLQFGKGTNTMTEPVQGLFLVVDDIEAARSDLIDRGVEVSEIWHLDLAKGPQQGPDPEGRSYTNRASFADPDGNQWVLQQITDRLPGRVEPTDIDALAKQLLDAAIHHGAFEAIAPEHNWWDWYAPYLDARQHGKTEAEAEAIADRYMEEAHGVVVSR
jgi:catechol 2,3-dioxygenase-like lactoylglutathione lyase family enzyme